MKLSFLFSDFRVFWYDHGDIITVYLILFFSFITLLALISYGRWRYVGMKQDVYSRQGISITKKELFWGVRPFDAKNINVVVSDKRNNKGE
jgi:hypothetical protein